MFTLPPSLYNIYFFVSSKNEIFYKKERKIELVRNLTNMSSLAGK